MTAFYKELRTLALPAAAAMAAIALPLVWLAAGGAPAPVRGWSFALAAAAFPLGAAFLVAIPFGVEFHYRTMGMLLSQPVPRMRVWTDKLLALALVLLALAAVDQIVRTVGVRAGSMAPSVTFLVMLACSGAFWTLLARSVVGGAVFSLAALMMLELLVGWIFGALFSPHPAMTALRLVYAGALLWLGWRLFERFEATGQADGDGLQAIAVPGMWAVLRPRPAGAIGNLVRKEIRLQQPTFLIAALFVASWLMAILWFSVVVDHPRVASTVLSVLLASYFPLVLLVSGTISVGEETTLGIRTWHLTLPVSPLAQWAIKLGVTVVVAALLAVGLPLAMVALAELAVVLPAGTLQSPSAYGFAAAAAALLVLSFWAGTLGGSTVKAVVIAGLTIAGLLFTGAFITWIAQRWDAGSDVLTWVMVRWQLPPDVFQPGRRALAILDQALLLGGAAVLGSMALWQSLTAFRAYQIGTRRVAASVGQLTGLVAFMTFATVTYLTAAGSVTESGPVRELRAAVRQVAAASIARDGRVPTAVTPEELSRTGLLSTNTSRWLADSQITVRTARLGASDVLVEVRFGSGRESRMFVGMETSRPGR